MYIWRMNGAFTILVAFGMRDAAQTIAIFDAMCKINTHCCIVLPYIVESVEPLLCVCSTETCSMCNGICMPYPVAFSQSIHLSSQSADWCAYRRRQWYEYHYPSARVRFAYCLGGCSLHKSMIAICVDRNVSNVVFVFGKQKGPLLQSKLLAKMGVFPTGKREK